VAYRFQTYQQEPIFFTQIDEQRFNSTNICQGLPYRTVSTHTNIIY